MRRKDKKRLKGFTLLEVLIGSFLLLVVFLSLFLSYQVGMKLIAQNKNRVAAISIAAGELEKIRNMQYSDVGLNGSGCYPCGIIQSPGIKNLNGIDYMIETRIDYVIDSADGISYPEDECPNDYKKAGVKVSWGGQLPGEIYLSEDLAPKTIAEECSETGGVLLASVYNAFGEPVSSPLIEIKNPDNTEVITSIIPEYGEHYFSLPAGVYKIAVSKNGFSSEQTFGIEEVALPAKSNPQILEAGFNNLSFFIDTLGSISVSTKSPWGMGYFFDSFTNEDNVSDYSNVTITEGELSLVSGQSSGYVISTDIDPANLLEWGELTVGEEKPVGTNIKYQVLYLANEEWVLVPDADLAGNSNGFENLPLSLSELELGVYDALRLKANLSTANPDLSPRIQLWQLSWKDSFPQAIPNVSFRLRGEKSLGMDESENVIFKYDQNHSSGSSGSINISNLEWDVYHFSIMGSLDLVGSEPSSPVDLPPGVSLPVTLHLQSQNSLLVDIKDAETGTPIFSAECHLHNSSYENTLYTESDGKVYFTPLLNNSYSLEIVSPGFSPYSGTINISGDTMRSVNLERIE